MTKPNTQAAPYINDLPRRELEKLKDVLPEVLIKIRRKTQQGPFVFLPQAQKSPTELLSGAFDMEMMKALGGGEYEYQCFDPTTHEEITPRWRIRYPGAPNPEPLKDASWLGYQHPGASAPGTPTGLSGLPVQGFGAPTGLSPGPLLAGGVAVPPGAYTTPGVLIPQMGPQGLIPPPPGYIPPQAAQLPANVQWEIYYTQLQRQGTLAPSGPGAGHADSRWADRFDTRQQAENAENKVLRDQIADMKAQMAAQTANAAVGQLSARIEALQHAQLQQQNGAGNNPMVQVEMMRMQMAAQQQQSQQQMQMLMLMMENRPKGPDLAAVITGLAALAGPFVTAYFSSQSSKVTSENQVHMRQMELAQQNNQTLVQTLLASGEKKSGAVELLGVLAPVVGPLIMGWLENRSPEALMAIQQQGMQGQMMLTKMVQEIIESQSNNGDLPWWAPMLQGLVEGAQDAVPLIMQMAQGAKQARSLPAGAQPVGQRPQQAPAQGQGTQGGQAPAAPQGGSAAVSYELPWEHLERVDAAVTAEVKDIFARLPPQLGFHTREWVILLFNLTRQVEPNEMADLLLTHVENAANLNMLPIVLDKVGEDPEIIRPFLMRLPIGARNPEYVTQVVDIVVDTIRNANNDDEQPVDVAGHVSAAPPPAPPAPPQVPEVPQPPAVPPAGPQIQTPATPGEAA